MPAKISPHCFAYPSYNDIFALNSIMYQQPYGVPGPAVGNEWNQSASNVHYGEFYYPNSDWHPKKKLSYTRERKRPFTIREILGLKNDEPENNITTDYYSTENSWSQRLTPEPIQTSSTRYLESEEVPHRVEIVTSSDTYMPNELPSYRLSPPCLEPQSANDSSKTSEEASSPNKKSKRIRTIFTPHQLEKLELEFQRSQYMVGSARLQLASELSLSESQVKVWFQNRRIKLRKQFHEMQQAKLAKLKENNSEEKQLESDISNSCQISSSCASSDES